MIDKDRFLVFIQQRGIDNPILAKDLALRFNCTERQLRELIMNLRRATPAVTIASGTDGYFYAESFAEIESTLVKMKTNAIAELTTRANLAKAFNVDLQGDLFI